MTLEEAIHDHLMADGPVLAILVSDRVFYGNAAQGQQTSPPYVTFTAVSRVSPETFQGDYGPLEARFQFDCYAVTAPKARDLCRAVRRALQGIQAVIPTGNPSGVFVQSALCEGGDAGRDGYDPETQLFTCSVDVMITAADD